MSQTKLIQNCDRLRRAWSYVSVAVIALVLIVTLFVIKPGMPDQIVLLTGAKKNAVLFVTTFWSFLRDDFGFAHIAARLKSISGDKMIAPTDCFDLKDALLQLYVVHKL